MDTGAEVSVLLPLPTDCTRPQVDFKLAAVNSLAIATYGKRSLTLYIGLRRTFRWIFIIADVQKPILGADFLQHFGLLVDIQRHKLVDSNMQVNVQCLLAQGPSTTPSIPTDVTSDEYLTLLSECPELTKVHNYNDCPVRHTPHITSPQLVLQPLHEHGVCPLSV